MLNKEKIYIYTKNKNFGERLARFVAVQHNSHVPIEFLTEITDSRKFQRNDILVCDEGAVPMETGCRKVQFVCRRGKQKDDEIFIYQSREALYRQLLGLAGTGGCVAEVCEPKTICVFSPGGSGLAAIRLAIERAAAQNVLYVNLCEFPVIDFKECDPGVKHGGPGVSELFLCTEQEEFQARLEQLSVPAGPVHMVLPVEHYKDLLDISPDEAVRFMEHVRRQTQFGAVILEIGQMFEYTLELMAAAERIVISDETGFLAEGRRKTFQRYCRREGKEVVWERAEFIPAEREVPENAGEIRRFIYGCKGEE